MFNLKKQIKQFSPKYSYKITRLNRLGKGFLNQEGVYKFQIEYYNKKGELKLTRFIAGKQTADIQSYKQNIQILINLNLIKYTIRTFDTTTTKIELENFQKEELENIIFLTDFSLQNHEVEPINDFTNLNRNLEKFLSKSQLQQVLIQIFDNLLELTKHKIYTEVLDLWLIIFDKNELFVELTDFDSLLFNPSPEKMSKITPFTFYLKKSITSTKIMFHETLKNPKYDLIRKEYNLDEIFQNK